MCGACFGAVPLENGNKPMPLGSPVQEEKRRGENSFLRIERKGWVMVMSLQLSRWSRIPEPEASLRGFGGAWFGYFPLSFFFCFLHFLGVLIIVGKLVIKVFPNSFPALVRFVCHGNEFLALIDKFNTFVIKAWQCMPRSFPPRRRPWPRSPQTSLVR